MNLARVSNNGQITVPIEIRSALRVKAGDKLFFQKENGEIIVQNPNMTALGEAQATIADSYYSEDEILADIMESRYDMART
jgi:AbrB family looped-hinge helix DNA binding protein